MAGARQPGLQRPHQLGCGGENGAEAIFAGRGAAAHGGEVLVALLPCLDQGRRLKPVLLSTLLQLGGKGREEEGHTYAAGAAGAHHAWAAAMIMVANGDEPLFVVAARRRGHPCHAATEQPPQVSMQFR